MPSRRNLLVPTSALNTVSSHAHEERSARPERKRLAVIATIWTYLSHAQHFVDRFLSGQPPTITCTDGLAALKITLAATRSCHQKQSVNVA